MLVFFSTSCGNTAEEYIKVCTRSRESGKESSQIIYSDGRIKNTDGFVSDDVEYYTVDVTKSFAFSVSCGTGKLIHIGDVIVDAEDNPVKDDTLSRIIDAACGKIDHMILAFEIIKDSDRYFVFIELNTNWQTPCWLYEYNIGSGDLTEIHKWDNVDLTGISISH